MAYESQLKSDRAELHRRVAAAIEAGDPESADENAALIAEHLEAAGDAARRLRLAHARRNVGDQPRHRRGATELGARPNDRRRIARRGPAPSSHAHCPSHHVVRDRLASPCERAGARFEELRQLCTAAGDKASLAIAMAGLVADHAFQGRMREASQLASEAMALIESIGDPTLTVGLSFAAIYAKTESGELCDVLRWSQRVIDLADGDPSKGNFIFGSPLALAFATRAMARYCLGRPGWRDDLRHGLAMARSADPMSYATVVTYVYLAGIPIGVLRPDDSAVREIEDALRIAERSGDDFALALARMTLGVALVHRQTDPERDRGQKLLAEVSDVFLRRRHNLGELPMVNVYLARERAWRGDRDDAIPLMRAAVDHLFREGQLLAWGIPRQVSWWRHCSIAGRR